jgi:hypothetical protein
MEVSPIVVDIETCGLPNAAEYLEPVRPDSRLKDPAKIEADIEEKERARNEKLALDWNVGRIVAIGWWTEEFGVTVRVCQDEVAEATALMEFWRECRHRTIVGYNIKAFDLRYLVRRSQLLGTPYPILNFSKYDRKGISDLYLDLTFGDGTYDQGAMRRTLHAFCRRFGLPVGDATKGSDVPNMVAAGNWEGIRQHVMSDVGLTVALGKRLGVINADVPEPVL